ERPYLRSRSALQILPDTPWREALIGLAHIAVQRDR
ncbi:hypothetical protein LTSEURB_5086, partial [Salmonella enterica subsp. enterica serovar Urbana str. R8-2977]